MMIGKEYLYSRRQLTKDTVKDYLQNKYSAVKAVHTGLKNTLAD